MLLLIIDVCRGELLQKRPLRDRILDASARGNLKELQEIQQAANSGQVPAAEVRMTHPIRQTQCYYGRCMLRSSTQMRKVGPR